MEERKDVKIEMRPLEVNLSDDMDGDRSNCCYEPVVVAGDSFGEGTNHYECSKCKGSCDLLTEEEKIKINATARDAINGLLSGRKVLTIVVHKPTNGSAHQLVGLPDVRAYAEAVVKSFSANLSREKGIGGLEAPRDEFVVVEVEIESGEVRVSELG